MGAKDQLLYEGKAKKIWSVIGEPNQLIHEFKNSLTAFNGQKKGEFSNKGELNTAIMTLLYQDLSKHNISTHFLQRLSKNEILTHKLQMIPLEIVVRRVAAGSLAKRLGWDEGRPLETPLVELYFKNDALGDPLINDEHAFALRAAAPHEVHTLKTLGLKVNDVLVRIFLSVGLDLIDFKLEFGKTKGGDILLADEISPDTCRLWDTKTGEKMDKDRFRRDLGNLQETYEHVYARLASRAEGKVL